MTSFRVTKRAALVRPVCYHVRMQKFLIGIDEAGRGPLAGPVAVGAACVPEDFDWSLVAGATDSKKMTEKSRERIYAILCELREAGKLDFAVAFSTAEMIDTDGIVPAIRSSLASALASLREAKPHEKLYDARVLLDGGLRAPEEFIDQETIIRGDLSEPVISLASIAAKVERDHLLVEAGKQYPAYGFEIHKGYGTLAHRIAIQKYGLCDFHRATFCTRFAAESAKPRAV